MIEERLEEFMKGVNIKNDKISEYINEEKGLRYPFNTPQLLCRVDRLELAKEELMKAKFENKVENKDYEMVDVDRPVPKYEITKNEADRFTITNKKVKAAIIYNVTNQLGIHNSYEDKEEAFNYCEELNKKVFDVLCK